MSIDRVHYFTIGCDCCETVVMDHDVDLLFTTHDDALDYLADNGWTVSSLGTIRCRRCSIATGFCQHHGHDWTPWMPCTCNGTATIHILSGCPLLRFCRYCDASESATLAELPTTTDRSG